MLKFMDHIWFVVFEMELLFRLSCQHFCPFSQCFLKLSIHCLFIAAGSIQDLKTGDCWFDPWLSQYSFQGLMIVSATGLIPLSQASIASTMAMLESAQRLGNNNVQSTG